MISFNTDTECLQCGETIDDHKGDPSCQFCCVGCQTAYQVQGQESFRKMLSQFADAEENGQFKLTLNVKGIHCGACLQKIERAIYSFKAVTFARVNMSTERLTFTWHGEDKVADDIVEKIENLGYQLRPVDAQSGVEDDELRYLLRAIAVAGFAAGNVMLLSVGLWTTTQETMGFATRDLFHWISAMIALPTVAYTGLVFFKSAFSAIRQGHANMDVPISLALILACVMSIIELVNHGEHVYFDSAVMLTFFLLIGRYLDARAKGRARQSAANLLSKLTGVAHVMIDGTLQTIAVSDVEAGMIARVSAGENMPADGTVTLGDTEVDISLITGESIPKVVTTGDEVYAGTTNLLAPIQIEISHKNDKSLLSDIVRMMEVAEQGNARFIRLADRAAQLYTPVVHAVSLLTFLAWFYMLGGDWQTSLLHAVTVLIITCPCALGLAVPVVQVLACSFLMRRGILLKSADALEKMAKVDTVIFDKTGTLTEGALSLLPGDWTMDDLQIAASLASHSNHPISMAITRAYSGQLLPVKVKEIAGKGLHGVIGDQHVKLGSRKWIGTPEMGTGANSVQSTTGELWLSVGGKPQICFNFKDQLRRDAVETIDDLKAKGLQVHILSGDQKPVVNRVANYLDITRAKGELSPKDKCTYIDNLHKEGRNILFVGDGLNDAPALTSADVSMSPSTAVDISQNAADIVFQGTNLKPIISAINTAQLSTKLVKQNFGLAVVYNMIAIPMGVAGIVTPLVAAIAMSSSSICVIVNAFRVNLQKAEI